MTFLYMLRLWAHVEPGDLTGEQLAADAARQVIKRYLQQNRSCILYKDRDPSGKSGAVFSLQSGNDLT